MGADNRMMIPWMRSMFLIVTLGISTAVPATAWAAPNASHMAFKRLSSPARTVVLDERGGHLATLTDGSRTVVLTGRRRVFGERTASVVRTAAWVRLLDQPFAGRVDRVWLGAALRRRDPDVLAIAMQFIEGKRPVSDGRGLHVAGDASYGPLEADGTRPGGSDFNDYLGVPWAYGDVIDAPEPSQARALDCSGFVRMVFGFRSGMALTQTPDGVRLPRRAHQMLDSAPGVVTIANAGVQARGFRSLGPGDLVFFDASTDAEDAIDHVGIYLGRDARGGHRFISSRKTVNGPTLGDVGGRSVIDGTGLYARGFRAARRL